MAEKVVRELNCLQILLVQKQLYLLTLDTMCMEGAEVTVFMTPAVYTLI